LIGLQYLTIFRLILSFITKATSAQTTLSLMK